MKALIKKCKNHFQLTPPKAKGGGSTVGYLSSMSGATSSIKYLKGLQLSFRLIPIMYDTSPASASFQRLGFLSYTNCL